jgi:Ser/Thr protein kinase RdoA (MazF antagonist)
MVTAGELASMHSVGFGFSMPPFYHEHEFDASWNFAISVQSCLHYLSASIPKIDTEAKCDQQMGRVARHLKNNLFNGIEEVSGSIPLSSTI